MDAANGEDVKVVQERLRHGPARITIGVYAQVVTLAKRKAQVKVVAMLWDGEKRQVEKVCVPAAQPTKTGLPANSYFIGVPDGI